MNVKNSNYSNKLSSEQIIIIILQFYSVFFSKCKVHIFHERRYYAN